jgi:hypothetical protein
MRLHVHMLVRARKLTHTLLELLSYGFVAAMAGGPVLVGLAPNLLFKLVGAVTVPGVLLRCWIGLETLEALLLHCFDLCIDAFIFLILAKAPETVAWPAETTRAPTVPASRHCYSTEHRTI